MTAGPPLLGSSPDANAGNERVRRSWAKQAGRYDRSIDFFERRIFGRAHRGWACERASGDTLEVAVGTGLNLPLYAEAVRLTGLDLSPEMLQIAKDRAAELSRDVDLREGDAHDLPFENGSFDTVVCTYSLCNIPDPAKALAEMVRVLRPQGRLILVDHIRSSSRSILWLQKLIEFFSRRLEGEHMTRRPAELVEKLRVDIIERERLGRAGVVERLIALKPAE